MSVTTDIEEKNMAHNVRIAEARVQGLIQGILPTLKQAEKILSEVYDLTSESDLQDACAKYWDDVIPVLEKIAED